MIQQCNEWKDIVHGCSAIRVAEVRVSEGRRLQSVHRRQVEGNHHVTPGEGKIKYYENIARLIT